MRRLYIMLVFFFGIALLAMIGCSSLDEDYSTHYGLMNTENSDVGENPASDDYTEDTVGIEDVEKHEEIYQKKDIMRNDEAVDTSE